MMDRGFSAIGLAVTLIAGLTGIAYTQDTVHMMEGEPSVAAYIDVMDSMKAATDRLDYTGDADFDFVLWMRPHHAAAIGMARVVLEYGADPEIAAIAERIIATQEADLALLQAWFAVHGAAED